MTAGESATAAAETATGTAGGPGTATETGWARGEKSRPGSEVWVDLRVTLIGSGGRLEGGGAIRKSFSQSQVEFLVRFQVSCEVFFVRGSSKTLGVSDTVTATATAAPGTGTEIATAADATATESEADVTEATGSRAGARWTTSRSAPCWTARIRWRHLPLVVVGSASSEAAGRQT